MNHDDPVVNKIFRIDDLVVSFLGENILDSISQSVDKVLKASDYRAEVTAGSFPTMEAALPGGPHRRRVDGKYEFLKELEKSKTLNKFAAIDTILDIDADESPWEFRWVTVRTDSDGKEQLSSLPGKSGGGARNRWIVDTDGLGAGLYEVRALASRRLSSEDGSYEIKAQGSLDLVVHPRAMAPGDIHPVAMRRTAIPETSDLAFWEIIRQSSRSLSFENFDRFLSIILCAESRKDQPAFTKEGRAWYDHARSDRHLPYTDSNAYRLLKVATEAFLMVNCGVFVSPMDLLKILRDPRDVVRRVGASPRIGLPGLYETYRKTVNGSDDPVIPYFELIREKLKDEPLIEGWFNDHSPAGFTENSKGCYGIIKSKLTRPCFIELIWNYWQEEGMLVQTLNAISRRFQNIRGKDHDPLAALEIDPLRPLNNLLWGYIQDEQHRLTLTRRNYEYDHHYGIRLVGKAIRDFRSADSRSKFIEAFHHLLGLCREFFCQDDDTTVHADGFPVLNGLKEVHTVLTEGQHNQFGDLPSTARIEMLMQQWILARPEMREFLPTRISVALPEPWMDRVDAMKHVQGWTDVSSLHFRNLAVFGEQILLSIRYGAWNGIDDAANAANWARFWRQEIQGYLHAYRAATGTDLTAEKVDTAMPSQRLQERLLAQVHRR